MEKVPKKDLLREDFLELCQTFHKVLDSDDYMDRLLDFVHLVVQVFSWFVIFKKQKYSFHKLVKIIFDQYKSYH